MPLNKTFRGLTGIRPCSALDDLSRKTLADAKHRSDVLAGHTDDAKYCDAYSRVEVELVSARISGLLTRGRPTAVPRFVVSSRIWVSVEASAFRPLSHISQEVLEVFPPLADGDASIEISVTVIPIWIGAPSAHSHPRRVSATILVAVDLTACMSVGHPRKRPEAATVNECLAHDVFSWSSSAGSVTHV